MRRKLQKCKKEMGELPSFALQNVLDVLNNKCSVFRFGSSDFQPSCISSNIRKSYQNISGKCPKNMFLSSFCDPVESSTVKHLQTIFRKVSKVEQSFFALDKNL